MFHMYHTKFISVTTHALDPLPPVTNRHTFSDPLPLERDVLYGRPLLFKVQGTLLFTSADSYRRTMDCEFPIGKAATESSAINSITPAQIVMSFTFINGALELSAVYSRALSQLRTYH